jgi:integrase
VKKLWYREFDDWWYVTVRENGKRTQKKVYQGKDNREEAERRFHRMMLDAGRERLAPDVLFAELVDLFLDHCQAEQAPAYGWYRNFLQSFVDSYKGTVRALKPLHVHAWLGQKSWSQSTQRQAIVAVKRVINWAFDEGYIRRKPLKKLKRPPMQRRQTLIAAETHQQMLKRTDSAFGVFLTALRGTGARPGEIRAVTAAMVNVALGVWSLPEHKTAKKTGKPRVVYLSPAMLKLTKKLVDEHPAGPLFRNSRGQPWTANAIRCRMRRMRKAMELPDGTVAYSYRHTYATDGLENGVPITEMAELLGHVDTKQVSQTYAHLDQRTNHMRKAAAKATE